MIIGKNACYVFFLILSQGISMISYGNASDSTFDETEISSEDFLELKNNGEIVILDVRTPAEYRLGHIENAILINIKSSEAYDKINQLNKNKTYYVYCRIGIRSEKAVSFMRDNGFDESYNIVGGIMDLQKKGIKLVK